MIDRMTPPPLCQRETGQRRVRKGKMLHFTSVTSGPDWALQKRYYFRNCRTESQVQAFHRLRSLEFVFGRLDAPNERCDPDRGG